MTPPTDGITAEVFREVMPPYALSADPLAAAFASIPPALPEPTRAWRLERAARLVHEIAGLMPANAPQSRIAAASLIVREATDDTFARVNDPGRGTSAKLAPPSPAAPAQPPDENAARRASLLACGGAQRRQ